jgi:hypothetical protein
LAIIAAIRRAPVRRVLLSGFAALILQLAAVEAHVPTVIRALSAMSSFLMQVKDLSASHLFI